MDFKGQWITDNGTEAFILVENDNFLFGFLLINDIRVPSWWYGLGFSATPVFNLLERRRDYQTTESLIPAIDISNIFIKEPTGTDSEKE